MKKGSIALAIALLLLPYWLVAQLQINGTVTDAETGNPLSGAHIVLNNEQKTTTNSKGRFYFKKLDKGVYNLRASFIGYNVVSKEIQLKANKSISISLEPIAYMGEEVIVKSVRAYEKSPTTFQNIKKAEIKEVNLGQDIPYLLNTTPSVVVTSDAGTGIGYTGIRIRGTDMNRINITMNGIPLNDAESHGVWWVNMPDFASSVSNIQVQRGVGTSTNGAAAFGASINIQTLKLNPHPYAEISNSYGSFNTWKHTASFGTGLLEKHWAFDGRLSKITTDGYIDRAWSNLKSLYLSGGYYGKKSILKFNILSGKEKTYQSWWGVPSVRLNDDMEGMMRYQEHWLYTPDQTQHMINSDSRTYNYYTYENQTDNYRQDHYQLFYSYQPNRKINLNTGIHYTYGRGYYEEKEKDESLSSYLLNPVIVGNDTISTTDIIRQKWLDNDFYGAVFSMNYKTLDNLELTIGGGWNNYEGDHFGEVIWARYMSNGEINNQYYSGTGSKEDMNAYTKVNYNVAGNLNIYGDLQYRFIDYQIKGIDDDQRDISQNHNFGFFNPKAGLYYDINENMSSYLSFAVANREPNRSNYVDAPRGEYPTSEALYDYELGYKYKTKNLVLDVTGYYMDYVDQLVLTGEINDVGAAIMVNVPESYRAGLELATAYQPVDLLKWEANATFSRNKIKNFTEYVDNWDTGTQASENLGETDISFSPEVVANNIFTFFPIKGLEIDWVSQYVGKQYIDNTSSEDRKLDTYLVHNARLNYTINPGFVKELTFKLLVNNVLGEEYESNAWVYRYILGNREYKMDGYFPQAGMNFLGGVTIKL